LPYMSLVASVVMMNTVCSHSSRNPTSLVHVGNKLPTQTRRLRIQTSVSISSSHGLVHWFGPAPGRKSRPEISRGQSSAPRNLSWWLTQGMPRLNPSYHEDYKTLLRDWSCIETSLRDDLVSLQSLMFSLSPQ
jgi:hypothetical protein